MNTAHENWYVYYPAPAEVASALPQLRAMQQRLADCSGVCARIEERVGPGASPTWMEVYEGVRDPDGFAATLAEAISASGWARELAQARRIERFRCL
jgi:hypothetical protein